MAGKRQRSNGTWEFKFTRKGVLLSPVYFTFDTEAEGDAYAARVEPLLERGGGAYRDDRHYPTDDG